MAFIDTVAERLAADAFEQAQTTNDPDLVDAVSKLLGTSSPSLQEAYDTAIRYLRAEARAREMMQERLGRIR